MSPNAAEIFVYSIALYAAGSVFGAFIAWLSMTRKPRESNNKKSPLE